MSAQVRACSARCRSRVPLTWFVAQKPPAKLQSVSAAHAAPIHFDGDIDARAVGAALGLALHVHRDAWRRRCDARVDLEHVGGLHADAAVRDEAAAERAAVRRAEVVDRAVDRVAADQLMNGRPANTGDFSPVSGSVHQVLHGWIGSTA